MIALYQRIGPPRLRIGKAFEALVQVESLDKSNGTLFCVFLAKRMTPVDFLSHFAPVKRQKNSISAKSPRRLNFFCLPSEQRSSFAFVFEFCLHSLQLESIDLSAEDESKPDLPHVDEASALKRFISSMH